MGVEEDREVALRFFASRFHDKKAAWELVDEDATWIIPGSLPMSGEYRGRQAIFDDYLGKHTDEFETITSSVLRTIAEPGVVVVEYHAFGRTKSGRDYDTIYYYVVDLDGGKIVKVRQSLDTLYAKTVVYD